MAEKKFKKPLKHDHKAFKIEKYETENKSKNLKAKKRKKHSYHD